MPERPLLAQAEPMDAAQRARETAARVGRLEEHTKNGGATNTGILAFGSIASLAFWYFFQKKD